MPNMFGGDQFHPDYDPREADRIKDHPRKKLVDHTLYTIVGDGDGMMVELEEVDGKRSALGVSYFWTLPDEVQQQIVALRGELIKKPESAQEDLGEVVKEDLTLVEIIQMAYKRVEEGEQGLPRLSGCAVLNHLSNALVEVKKAGL